LYAHAGLWSSVLVVLWPWPATYAPLQLTPLCLFWGVCVCVCSSQGILNKLTPDNFEKLSQQLLDVGINEAKTLIGLIAQVGGLLWLLQLQCAQYTRDGGRCRLGLCARMRGNKFEGDCYKWDAVTAECCAPHVVQASKAARS
jgi:hypothetical protein